jgi:hypothetical protein
MKRWKAIPYRATITPLTRDGIKTQTLVDEDSESNCDLRVNSALRRRALKEMMNSTSATT